MASPQHNGPFPFDGTDLEYRNREHVPMLEEHLISCCLQDDGDILSPIDDATELVTSADFVLEGHAVVFEAVLECRRESHAVLAADVYDRLTKTAARNQRVAGALADLKPNLHVWLERIVGLEVMGTRVRHYATYVREASLFRQLRGVASEIAQLASMPTGAAADVLGQCERLLFDITDASATEKETMVDSRRLMQEACERVDSRQESGGSLGGMSTGLPDLDNVLGGLRPGQLVVVGARPGGGKTAFGLTLTANAAMGGQGVLFFSMEMPRDQIGDRLLTMGSGVPMSKLTRGGRLSADDLRRVMNATGPEWVSSSPLYVDDASDQPAMRIAAKTRRAVRRLGVGLVVVDYLQLMRPEGSEDNRQYEVGLAARRLKQIARDCGVPLICLSQLNRAAEQRGNEKPRLSDLRESGEIEQHADIVIFMHKQPNQTDDMPVWSMDAVVAKNRNGPIADVPLAYRRAIMRFESLSGANGLRRGAA